MTESSTHSVNGKLTQKILKFVITENTVSNYIEIRKNKLSAFFAQSRKNRYHKRAILSPYSYKEVRHLCWTELTILFFPAFLISTTNYHFGQKTMPLFSHYRLEFFFLFNYHLDSFYLLNTQKHKQSAGRPCQSQTSLGYPVRKRLIQLG